MKLSEIVSWCLNILLVSALIILLFKLQVPKYEQTRLYTTTDIKEIPKYIKKKIPAIHDTITIDNSQVVIANSDTNIVDENGNWIYVSYYPPPYNFFDVQYKLTTKEVTVHDIQYQEVEKPVYIDAQLKWYQRIRPTAQVGYGITLIDKQVKPAPTISVGISYILW